MENVIAEPISQTPIPNYFKDINNLKNHLGSIFVIWVDFSSSKKFFLPQIKQCFSLLVIIKHILRKHLKDSFPKFLPLSHKPPPYLSSNFIVNLCSF